MDDLDLMTLQFDTHRARLRSMSYRMLGSAGDADDALQETWIRLNRTGPDRIQDLAGWLTTVTTRVCLTMLSTRTRRAEQSIDTHLDDRPSEDTGGSDPEQEALFDEAVGAALMVVLDRLSPGERVAFVLHDLFALPFAEIGLMVGRSAAAVRQLASRARRRVRDAAPEIGARSSRQRKVVDAFFAAARNGDVTALLALLDPDVVLRTSVATDDQARSTIRGAQQVADRALMFAGPDRHLEPVVIDGVVGVLVRIDDHLVSAMKFTVEDEIVLRIDAFTEPEKLLRFDSDGGLLGAARIAAPSGAAADPRSG